MGKFTKWTRQNSWFLILLIAAIIVTLEIFRWDSGGVLAERIVAWATILLAIATVALATVTVNEGRKARKEQRDREDRERKERLLNEIRDWANVINSKVLLFVAESFLTDGVPTTPADVTASQRFLKHSANLGLEGTNLEYFTITVKEFSQELIISIDHLKPLITQVVQQTQKLGRLTVEILKVKQQGGSTLKEEKEYSTVVNQTFSSLDALRAAIDVVGNKVAKDKTTLLKK